MTMNTVADTKCYGCKGTARIIGFGATGRECACVAHCEICDGAIAWSHDDEKAPLLCVACACPSTKRSIFCEGLATWLVWYTVDTFRDGDEQSCFAYVDATSADEAVDIVFAWGIERATVVAQEFTGHWERAEARRLYRESAHALRTLSDRLPTEPGLYETFVTRLASEGVSEATVARVRT